MWDLFNCYLSGRHNYGMWCEPGNIFLRCLHCGKRSSGWSIEPKMQAPLPRQAVVAAQTPSRSAVIPFHRVVAR
jgi:hypothetical protein